MDVTVRPGNKIVVYIDSMKGVTLEECIAVSRFLESNSTGMLKILNWKFLHPGLDNPLKLPVQYEKNMGRMLDVVKFDGIKITGKLTGHQEDGIRLETETIDKRQQDRKEEEGSDNTRKSDWMKLKRQKL